MYGFLHLILVPLFVVLPGVAVVVDLARGRRRGRLAPSPGLILTWCGGVVIGGCGTITFGLLLGAKIGWAQLLLAIYFASGLLLVLKGLDIILRVFIGLLWNWVRRPKTGDPTKPRLIDVPFAFARVAVLFGVGVPYVAACVSVYRPNISTAIDPQMALGARFDPVDFRTKDGLTLRGWWIPAMEQNKSRSRQTVLLCHGFGPGKSSVLPLAKTFLSAGFNVLAFDFRAHGESDGQLTGYGASERRDVQAALGWVRERHAGESEQLFGVGVDFGAAALISAAGERGTAGDFVNAIASIGGFDRFKTLSRSLLGQVFLSPLDRFIGSVGLPIASGLVGDDLVHFAPATDVNNVWPRPIFFIHGEDDEIVPFELGQDLAKAAPQPKRRLWTQKQSHRQVADDEDVAKIIIQFFNRARSDPVI